MQFKLFSVIALATLAVATPTRRNSGDECTTGPIQCCNSVQKADSDAVSKILALLGVEVQDVNVLVGLTCTAVDIIGGGNNCSGEVVCCKDNSFHGVIAIGCTPINIGL